MRIYFAHPTSIDYQELYAAIRADEELSKHEVILPHESPDHENNPRDFYKTLDLVVAEVSAPSTGLGIELGWARDDGVPVYAFHRAGTAPSSSIYSVTNHVATYSTTAEFCNGIRPILAEDELTPQHINQIDFINSIYFGWEPGKKAKERDATRDYLPDDIKNTLEGLIQHDVMVKIFKWRHSEFKYEWAEVGESGQEIKHFGNYDPKFCLPISDILKTFDKGLIVSVRKLVKDEKNRKKDVPHISEPGSCTGGSFIKDLLAIDLASVKEFFSNNAVVPFDEESAKQRLGRLQKKAESVRDRGYYGLIVKENEAIGLHKDKKAIKRTKRIESEKGPNGFEDMNMTIYTDLFSVKSQYISECLEDFAELVKAYRELLSDIAFDVHPLRGRGVYLKSYINNMYMSLDPEINEDQINDEVECIRKKLGTTLDILDWV